ncbi:hypothetical protein A2U01_0082547, partial [Trifolium medium]|nr:hypothetical protein [Trifolium medium]
MLLCVNCDEELTKLLICELCSVICDTTCGIPNRASMSRLKKRSTFNAVMLARGSASTHLV